MTGTDALEHSNISRSKTRRKTLTAASLPLLSDVTRTRRYSESSENHFKRMIQKRPKGEMISKECFQLCKEVSDSWTTNPDSLLKGRLFSRKAKYLVVFCPAFSSYNNGSV